MTLILVFLLIFAAVALLLYLGLSRKSGDTKKTLFRLDNIRFGPQSPEVEENDPIVKRPEMLSGIGWLNTLLAGLDLARRLGLVLYQSEGRWTVGRLLLPSAIIGFVCGYLVYFRTGALLLSLV